jgi:hypothetical protein
MKVLLIIFLVGVAAVGIAHVVNPSSFVKRSGVRKGGEMLNDWNETGFQLLGVILAGGAIYGIYLVFRSS